MQCLHAINQNGIAIKHYLAEPLIQSSLQPISLATYSRSLDLVVFMYYFERNGSLKQIAA
jgi:hypothetical protein